MRLLGPQQKQLALLFGLACGAGAIFAGACTDWNDAIVSALDGAGGTPETGVEAGTGGDARADGASCQGTSYLSLSDGARLCSLAFQCLQLQPSIIYSSQVPIDQNNFSLCMTWASGPVDPNRIGFALQQTQLQCAAGAASCLAADACFVYEELDPSDPRCDGGPDSGACLENGNAALNCSSLQIQHCNLGGFTPGETCQAAAGAYLCALPTTCPAAPECLPGGFLDGCIGPTNLHGHVDCQTLGSLCSPTPIDDAGTIACGTPCNFLGPTCGDGGVVVCDGYESSLYDCTAVCGSCASANQVIYCAHPGDKCTPSDTNTNQCAPDGKTISLCIAGQPTTFDCSTINKKCLPGTPPQTSHCG